MPTPLIERFLNPNSRLRVTVFELRMSDTSTCAIKGCCNPDKYACFNLDGKPSLSRLEGTFCEQHLEQGIADAQAANQATLDKAGGDESLIYIKYSIPVSTT